MGEPAPSLKAALADRYAIERELGRGGMATVYLARDLKHDRPVAIKVLRPDLVAVLGPERFLREIRLTAQLQHPHILNLLDSGQVPAEAGTPDFLYYVMPYAEGETLRARLIRDRQLPVGEALALTRIVAGALEHAHRLGVVHRDIKPENILMHQGEPMVVDFGVAFAAGAGRERLTEAGFSLGTPAYMSPEQATGEAVDGRSDVYSLGCVLYEMLAGEPPHLGSTAQAILGKRLGGPVPSVRHLRESVPQAVDAALVRAMAKSPADRFATAAEFAKALAESGDSRATPRAARRLGMFTAGAAVMVALVIAYVRHSQGHEPALDADAVLILPFRVTGADPGLAYLREGMLDLLATKLTGERGPRAVDVRTALRAWDRAGGTASSDLDPGTALELARRLGARRVLQGSVVGSVHQLHLTAEVVERSGRSAPPATVEGPLDSLSALVDKLTAAVLASVAGESHRLADLTTHSLPALRAYLDGQASYRADRFEDAVGQFSRALELDSTFALAALGLRSAAGWTAHNAAPMARGISLAWAARARLTPHDRLFLIAAAGPRYPDASSVDERLRAWDKLVQAAPDQAEAHHELGDLLFHFGPAMGLERARERAGQEFARALELDSSFAPPLSHLVDFAAHVHDTAALRRLGKTYLARRPPPDDAEYVRWRVATGLSDTGALAVLRTRFESFAPQALASIFQTTQAEGIALEDAEHAGAVLLRRAETPQDREHELRGARQLALNRGRPLAADSFTAQYASVESVPGRSLYLRVLDALYWDGDTASARRSAILLAKSVEAPRARLGVARAGQVNAACALGLWGRAHGDTGALGRAIARLRAETIANDSTIASHTGALCASLLEAGRAADEHLPDAADALASIDSLLATGPYAPRDIRLAAGLEVARMYEARGSPTGALRALRRRDFLYGGLEYLSTGLREEGRLAELMGDRASAFRAYQHYLRLRSNPEPGLRAQVSTVRGAVAALIGEQ
jgi:tetratricopeptide (TPR) repeat protein